MRCATWNVLTLNNNAALPLLSKELNKLNISLAGLQETRLCDSGETLCDGFRLTYGQAEMTVNTMQELDLL